MSGLMNWRRKTSKTVGGRFCGRAFSPKISRRRAASMSERPSEGEANRPATSSVGRACHAVVLDSSGEIEGAIIAVLSRVAIKTMHRCQQNEIPLPHRSPSRGMPAGACSGTHRPSACARYRALLTRPMWV
ncbi:hypothetical protein DSECCO2_367290 [anaerobic digester metagenome]